MLTCSPPHLQLSNWFYLSINPLANGNQLHLGPTQEEEQLALAYAESDLSRSVQKGLFFKMAQGRGFCY